MAWTNLTFPFGSVLTSTQMTQLDDNFDAVMAKSSGSPVLADDYIVTAMIADSQVTTTKLASGERMTTANVIAATAGASTGAVGSYAMLLKPTSGAAIEGSTVAGSSLKYSNSDNTANTGPAGTWRAMGYCPQNSATVWLRIS